MNQNFQEKLAARRQRRARQKLEESEVEKYTDGGNEKKEKKEKKDKKKDKHHKKDKKHKDKKHKKHEEHDNKVPDEEEPIEWSTNLNDKCDICIVLATINISDLQHSISSPRHSDLWYMHPGGGIPEHWLNQE